VGHESIASGLLGVLGASADGLLSGKGTPRGQATASVHGRGGVWGGLRVIANNVIGAADTGGGRAGGRKSFLAERNLFMTGPHRWPPVLVGAR